MSMMAVSSPTDELNQTSWVARPGAVVFTIASIVVTVMLAGCARVQSAKMRAPGLLAGERSFRYQHNAELFTVKNGLTVILLPVSTTNLVKVDVRFQVGAAEDPAGRSGLAHLVEHLSFQLRQNSESGPTINAQLGDIALAHNAYTIWDETHYSSVALSGQLVTLLTLELARMKPRCEQIDDATFAREREVVRNELRERAGIGAELGALLSKHIYGADHAYSRPVGGSDADLVAVTRADVCAFMDTYYRPSNAILAVSGNLDSRRVRMLIGNLFGTIEAREVPARKAVAALGRWGADSRHTLAVEEATALIAFPALPFMDPKAAVERLLIAMLKPQLHELISQHSFITDINVGSFGGVRAPAWIIAVSVDHPSKLDDAVSLVFEAGQAFVETIEEDSVSAPRERYRSELLRGTEPFMSQAAIFTDYIQYADHDEFLLRPLRAVAAESIPALKLRAGRLLVRSTSHVALIYPDPAARPVEERASLAFRTQDHEQRTWRAPIDLAEAQESLTLPAAGLTTLVREFTLDNGMRVVFAPRVSPVEVIDIRLMFSGGSLHEPAGKRGLAQAASSLLARNMNVNLPKGMEGLVWLNEIKLIMGMGAELSRYTDETTTTFRMTGLSMYADGLLWDLNFLLESGIYDRESIAAIRARLGKGTSDKAEAQRRREQAVLEALYGRGHPYANPGFGTDMLATISEADMHRFREQHYRAGSATMIVTGNFDSDMVEAQIRRLFGAWSAGEAAGPKVTPMPVVPAQPRALLMVDEDQVRTHILMAFIAPSGFRTKHAERLVLQEIVRLRMTALRDELGASYGASVMYVARQGPGLLLIEAAVDRERASEALMAMREALEAIRTGDFTADFIRARRRVVQTVLADTLDSESVADELEMLATHELAPLYYDQLAERVAALRPSDIVALVGNTLSGGRQVILIAGKEESAAAAYQAIGITGYATLK